jgi:hypothetical protein
MKEACPTAIAASLRPSRRAAPTAGAPDTGAAHSHQLVGPVDLCHRPADRCSGRTFGMLICRIARIACSYVSACRTNGSRRKRSPPKREQASYKAQSPPLRNRKTDLGSPHSPPRLIERSLCNRLIYALACMSSTLAAIVSESLSFLSGHAERRYEREDYQRPALLEVQIGRFCNRLGGRAGGRLGWPGRRAGRPRRWPAGRAGGTSDLPRTFRTADLWLIHAADCRSRYSLRTCCGVRY